MQNIRTKENTLTNHNQTVLTSLMSELKKLSRDYKPYISEEALQGEIGCLSDWAEAYSGGDDAAGYYLKNYGKILLDKVKMKLQTAVQEIQRVDDESPNAKNFSGGKAGRLADAADLASKASEKLEKIFIQ